MSDPQGITYFTEEPEKAFLPTSNWMVPWK